MLVSMVKGSYIWIGHVSNSSVYFPPYGHYSVSLLLEELDLVTVVRLFVGIGVNSRNHALPSFVSFRLRAVFFLDSYLFRDLFVQQLLLVLVLLSLDFELREIGFQ